MSKSVGGFARNLEHRTEKWEAVFGQSNAIKKT